MNVRSLFTGIGGFDRGLELAGHAIVDQCEIDEWRRGVLAANFPGVPCYADVRALCREQPRRAPADAALSELERRERPDAPSADRIDLVCGGFPCQDLSVAGRRAGLAGERSGLFYEFARVADLVLPPGGWILVENVPGLLSSQGGRDFAVVLATLADLGFHDLAWRVLDSRYFGVAQRRRRVYILARRARGSRACTVLLEPESSGGDPQTRGEAGEDVAGTLGLSSGAGGFRTTDLDGHGAFVKAYHFRTRETGSCFEETEVNVTRASVGGSGGAKLAIAVGVAENQRGELLETDYAHQLTSGGGKPGQGYGAARTAEGVRRLTPVECERLQGFPDGWTAYGPDSRRYAALGDAVTVPVAEWIGRRLQEVA